MPFPPSQYPLDPQRIGLPPQSPAPVPPGSPPQGMATQWLMLNVPDVPGWQRGESQDHGPDQGFVFGYDHPAGIVATVFVYNRGLGVIQRQLPVLESEVQEAVNGVLQMVQLGRYQSARELDRGTITLSNVPGSPLAVRARLMIAQDSPERLSSIYITTHRGFFFKIRISLHREPSPEIDQIVSAFLATLASSIQE
jgi:hypothetical protein